MAKETVEKEVEEVNKYIKEETYWTCDDCRREFDEEELAPLVVAPRMETPAFQTDREMRKIERLVDEYFKWKSEEQETMEIYESVSAPPYHDWGYKDEVLGEIRVQRKKTMTNLVQELLDKVHDMSSPTAAATLDVCPECLEDNYGITVEEHDGRLFEERNYDETVERTGLPEGEKLGMMVISFCSFGVIYTLTDAGVSEWGVLPAMIILSFMFFVLLSH